MTEPRQEIPPILAHGVEEPPTLEREWLRWLPLLLLAVLAIAASVLASNWFESLRHTRQRDVALMLLSSKAHALSEAIRRRVDLVDGLAAFVEATDNEAELRREFELYAAGLHAGADDLRSLAIAPNGVIGYVYPAKGNEVILGLDLLADPQSHDDALRAIKRRSTALSDPFQLRQGGLGLTARKPIFKNELFWGFVSIAVPIPAILAEAGIDHQDDYSTTLRDRTGRVFFGDPGVLGRSPVVIGVNLPEGRWELAAVPRVGWDTAIRKELLLFRSTSLCAALLLALVLFQGYEKHRRLRMDVIRRGHALSESESYNRTLFELSPIGLALSSIDGVLVDVNPAFASILGLTVPETIGLSYAEITPPAYAEQEERQLQSLEKSGSYGPYEKEFLHRHGHPVAVRLQGRIIERNQVRFIWSSVEDITQRKQLEENLKERNQILSLFAEHNPAAIAMLDRDMRYLIVSRRWVEDYQLGGRQIIGRSHYELFPELPERWKDVYRRCLAGASEKSEQDQFVRQDGKVDWVRWEAHPWRTGGGEIGGIIIFSENITARKQAEAALRREHAFSEALIDALPGVVYLYDKELRFLRWNKNFEGVTGYGAQEVARMNPADFFGAADRRLLRAKAAEVFSAGVSSMEADLVAKDGSRTPYFFTGVRTEIDERTCLIGIGIDISARKRLEEQLTLLNQNLESRVVERTRELQKSRLALVNLLEDLNEKSAELVEANEKLKGIDRLKSMFIASMSHELRTPLNSVIGYSSILLNEWLGPLSAEQKEHLGIVLRAGKHLLSLINDVIDISKIEAGQMEVIVEEFDLFDLVLEACQELEAEIRAKGLSFSVNNLHLPMKTDRRRLLQATLNVLSNAMKYTVQGSVQLAVKGEAGWAEIAVADTGIGISEKDAPLIFRPFVRVDSELRSAVSGTGLGLYLTRKLTSDILGGTVSFTSRQGEGSTFTVRVPAVAAGADQREGKAT